jgi:transposase-like protein
MLGFGPPAIRRARQEWWRCQMQRQQDGNLSVAEFCRRLGVSTVTFYAWKRRFRETPKASPHRSEGPGDVQQVAQLGQEHSVIGALRRARGSPPSDEILGLGRGRQEIGYEASSHRSPGSSWTKLPMRRERGTQSNPASRTVSLIVGFGEKSRVAPGFCRLRVPFSRGPQNPAGP